MLWAAVCPAVLQGTLFARRKAAAVVRGDAVLHKLFTEIAERYAEREGGYTRVLRSRRRNNDAAQMAFIECAFQSTGPLQFVRTTERSRETRTRFIGCNVAITGKCSPQWACRTGMWIARGRSGQRGPRRSCRRCCPGPRRVLLRHPRQCLPVCRASTKHSWINV
jgi:hypothetical protein